MIMLFLTILLMVYALIFVHELGHYLVARSVGVAVTRFSVGLGPRLLAGTDRRGVEWSLNLVPLGGAVAFAPSPDPIRPFSIYHVSLFRRVLVYAAGPIASLLFGIALLYAVAASFGAPYASPVTTALSTAAAEAGFRKGDRVIAVMGVRVRTAHDVVATSASIPASDPPPTVDIVIERDGAPLTMQHAGIVPVLSADGAFQRYSFGLYMGRTEFDRTASLGQSVGAILSYLQALVPSSSTGSSVSVSGPVGLVVIVQRVLDAGLPSVLLLTALLSLSFGVFNLLPIPMLDGGAIALSVLEAGVGRARAAIIEPFVNRAGALALLALMVVVTIFDIGRLS